MMMMTAPSATPTRRPVLELYLTTEVAISSETRFMTLISGLIEGPAVSLNGSPTVSPTMVASCAAEPLPPWLPARDDLVGVVRGPAEGGEKARHHHPRRDRARQVRAERRVAEREP